MEALGSGARAINLCHVEMIHQFECVFLECNGAHDCVFMYLASPGDITPLSSTHTNHSMEGMRRRMHKVRKQIIL